MSVVARTDMSSMRSTFLTGSSPYMKRRLSEGNLCKSRIRPEQACSPDPVELLIRPLGRRSKPDSVHRMFLTGFQLALRVSCCSIDDHVA